MNVKTIDDLNISLSNEICKIPIKQSIGDSINNEIRRLKTGYIIKYFNSKGYYVDYLYCLLK